MCVCVCVSTEETEGETERVRRRPGEREREREEMQRQSAPSCGTRFRFPESLQENKPVLRGGGLSRFFPEGRACGR